MWPHGRDGPLASLGRLAPWAEISLGKAAGALGGELWLTVITWPQASEPVASASRFPRRLHLGQKRTKVVAGPLGDEMPRGPKYQAESWAACRPEDGLAYVCI